MYLPLITEIYNRDLDLGFLTFETNGTQKISDNLFNFLSEYGYDNRIETTFSISAKLPCSGESWEDAIKPEIISKYLEVPNNRSYFKFVVSNAQDIEDVKRAIAEYKKFNINIPVYLMPVGGVNSVYEMNERQVADFCRDNGFRFSPRIQVPLYKNQWGT